jgi:RNA polymerase sigma factor (sigma-70 family)
MLTTFDERYITGLQNRDPETEAHFVAYFRRPIQAKAGKHLWQSDSAEDACQETMLRVLQYFRSGKRLEDPARLPAFVLSVCHNVIQEMNRKGRDQQFSETWDLPDPQPGPFIVVVTAERKQLMRKILDKLRKKDRELLLALLDGADRAELCRRFGVTEAYLRVLLHRAVKRFTEELRKLEDADQPAARAISTFAASIHGVRQTDPAL